MTAQPIIEGLVARGLPLHVAIGVAGNMQVESDGFKTDVNEYAPLVPGSRGGYGLNQWTGPRRVQFEEFARSRGVDPSDLNAQLDFTVWELQNTEKRAGEALMQASTPAEAARIYSEKFLRPGIPHLDRRIAAAERLAGGEYQSAPIAPQPPQPGMQAAPPNQLAQRPQPPRIPDNAFAQPMQAYKMPVNQLAPGGFDPSTNPFLAQMRPA